MFKIGEFSKLSMLTIKALRFYEKEGLLIPVHVDEWSGYRFYEAKQLETAATIKALRQLDFSVEEIKAHGFKGGAKLIGFLFPHLVAKPTCFAQRTDSAAPGIE